MARTFGICTDRDITYIEGLVGGGYQFKARLHFTGGGTLTPSAGAAATVASGRTAIIRLEPRNADGTDIPGVLDQFNSGAWDARIDALAAWLKDPARVGKPIVITPLHEMNGDWYGWSGAQNGGQAANAPLKYRNAYRRIVTRLRAAGVGANVKFGWNPNNGATPGGGLPATLMSDAFTGADGTAWDAAKWSLGRNSSDGVGGATVVGGKGVLATGAQGIYNGQARVSRRANLTAPVDVDMTGSFAYDASEAFLTVWARASSALDTASGYYLSLFRQQTPKLGRAASFTSTSLGDLSSGPLTPGVEYSFRFRVVGSTVQAKVWPATASEPATWGLTVTDTTITAGGAVGFSVGGGSAASSSTVTVDNVRITNGGSLSWNDYSNYYPGDDVVDEIGFDGYNDGGDWATCLDLFNGTLADKSNSLPCYDRVYQTGTFANGAREAKWCNLDGKVRPFVIYETGSRADTTINSVLKRKGDFFKSIPAAVTAMPNLETLVLYEVVTGGKDRRVDVDTDGVVAPTGYAATSFKQTALDPVWGSASQIVGGPYAFALADGATSTAFPLVTPSTTGAAAVVSGGQLALTTGTTGDGRVSVRWSDGPITDCEIVGTVSWDANTTSPRIYARANTLIDTTVGYFLLFDQAAQTYKVGHAGIDSLGAASLAQTVGTKYRFRWVLSGTRLRARAWPANGVEPSNWPIDVLDSSWGDPGHIGMTTRPKVLTTPGTNWWDDITISAALTGVENKPPVIDFGVAPDTATIGQPYTASVVAADPDGGALVYRWLLESKPTRSTATVGSTSASVTFTPDAVGTYGLRCTVTEPGGLTATVLKEFNAGEAVVASGSVRYIWWGGQWVRANRLVWFEGWNGPGPNPGGSGQPVFPSTTLFPSSTLYPSDGATIVS